jgi:hypothetical protein
MHMVNIFQIGDIMIRSTIPLYPCVNFDHLELELMYLLESNSKAVSRNMVYHGAPIHCSTTAKPTLEPERIPIQV